MPPAARIGDRVGHGAPTGTVGLPGVAAAGPGPAGGVGRVLIGGLPAAVVGTVCGCPVPPPHQALGPGNVVLPGPPPPRGQVLIGGFPAARVGDRTSCSAVIMTGALNVIIGG
ncbi:PAAR domain-containing protein [Plantactinospora soyae]|uniref:Zn-binding protein involved in type VI secretion n=1 Tax=Plantactinospora soyae TaxID=1544732 RepID=A0A927M9Z5_9ACTN|nr:PAAR domain-containing protein [Plantactinospora soyae]MBE1489291.1 putative Zn-binding protein involved in type VI secretion [Plantactinospora soyae]